MPIPALRVKSPQNWKKKKSYPSDSLIARRRQSALRGGGSFLAKKKKKAIALAKRSSYYGKRNKAGFKRQLSKRLVKIGVVVLLAVFLLGLAVFFYYSSQVPSRQEILASAEGTSTKIYDRSGEHILYNLSSDKKKIWIPLDQIPEHVKWAVIAIEDDQFYTHPGFDLPALVKVGLHEVFGIGPKRGGSTITQQLVKNTLLTPERTYRRKVKEMIISYQMEKKFSKDEILELYFNVVPYGSTAYGIEAAAEMYFGEHASQLDIAEGAILAAMLQAVTYYSPYGLHVDELMARQHFVLSQMAKLGYISQEEADAAKQEKLEFKKLSHSIQAPHFSLYIKELLAAKYGEEIVEKGGLKVITTLDWEKQQIAEAAIQHGVERNEPKYAAHNAALVSIDATSGEVLAMVGSRDYFNEEYDGAVNVTMRPRQPGSSFKPVVYAAAFEQGLSPRTILFDSLTSFKTETDKNYEPHNYDDKEHGPVPIRQALAGSLNIPAVKTIYLTGIDNVLNLAEKMGYTTFEDRSRFGLSLVLGGGEVKLIEHVKAFAVFAQNGRRHNLEYILKVEDKNGKVLEQLEETENLGEEVMDSQVAKKINNILSDDEARAFVFGAGSYLTLADRPVAAKTGTTNDYRDGWTIGYTPSIVAGVWVGNNDNTPMKGKAAGGNVAAPIWHEYMSQALKGTAAETFDKPKSEELPEKPMLNGKIAQEKIIKIDKASGKLATDLTPPSFIEERTFQELHSILHYVNKKNILGPIPEHPENDPQYENWEAGVAKWAQENEIEIKQEMPEGYDDLHTMENKPVLSILLPSDNQHYTKPILNVKVQVTTKRLISRLEYYIDDQLISTQSNWPYDLSDYQLLGFSNGQRWLKVVAYDDIDNSQQKSLKIYFDLPKQYTQQVAWLSPTDNDIVYAEQFPYNLKVKINNYSLYNKVDFYIKKEGESSVWINYRQPQSPEVGTLLTEASQGDYDFYVVLTKKNGEIFKDEGIKVKVIE